MKKVIFTLTAALLFSAVCFAESCKDQVVVLTDENPLPDAPTRITMFLDCHSANSEIPESTTLNYWTFHQGKFCHAHRVCGNIWNITGDLRIGTKWYFGEALGSVYDNWSDNDNEDSNNSRWYQPGYGFGMHSVAADNVYAEFKIGFEKINHFCKKMKAWECIDIPTFN